MMEQLVLVRYTEIALKGTNRGDFEKALVCNLQRVAEDASQKRVRVSRSQGRVFIHTAYDPAFRLVFGVTSLSPAIRVSQDLPAIRDAALQSIRDSTPQSFRVSASRSDKGFPYTSPQIERDVGAHIQKHTGTPVRLKEADIEIGIDISSGHAHVFTEKIEGAGGLPLGTQGHATCEIRNPHDELAALLLMRRGVSMTCSGEESRLVYAFSRGLGKSNDAGAVLARVRGERVPPYRSGEALDLYPLVGLSTEECESYLNHFRRLADAWTG